MVEDMSTITSLYTGVTVVSNWKFSSIITSMQRYWETYDVARFFYDRHRMLTTHEVNVDVHSQIRARLRRFRPCLQVNIALEGCKIDHKATLAAFFHLGSAWL